MSTKVDTEKQDTLINKRISIGSLTSLDSRAIIDNLDLVISHLKSRRAGDATIDAAKQIAARNDERVALIQSKDSALQTRNEQSAKIGKLMRNPERDENEVEEAKRLSNEAADEASVAEEKLSKLEEEVSTLLSSIPNLLDDITPDGDNEDDNEEVEVWGDISSLQQRLGWPEDGSFEPLWHDDVATNLDGWKAENAVAISGARFVALSGNVARLERALSSFFLDMHSTKHGYTEVSVPLVVGRSALEGTSQLPKFEEDLFRIAKESHQCNGQDAFLIPTAEVPLTNMHRDTILEESELPISYVALTPCFRAEAGSYGRDTRGLIRTHQFSKVELVKITTSDSSVEQHEELTRHAQACLEALELSYRKVRLSSGDIGFAARHCYDLEVWLPGSKEFREISSCSNTGDFQAKRMNLRYRPAAKEEQKQPSQKGGKKKKAKKPKPVFCHTINGSGLAVGRTLVAVLENYQMPDGSVVVPDVLRPYLGGMEFLK
jgi:seryl-tRNA synthetase